MTKNFIRIALLVSVLTWPALAFADAPPNVSGITAHIAGGQISVHWDAPGDGIRAYRIYYGQKSILGNDGAYDDFVTTSGKNTDFILSNIPNTPDIFLTVAAVNTTGEESASFIEEVQLPLGNGDADGQSSTHADPPLLQAPSPSRKQRESGSFGLIAAIAQSNDTVQLTFSTAVHIARETAAQAFTMVDNKGNAVQMRRLTIQGSAVTIMTEPLAPARLYAIRANDVVTSDPAAGSLLPIDGKRNTVTFLSLGGSATSTKTGQPLDAAVHPITVAPAITSRPKTGLPSSGLPVLGVMMVGGAFAGWKKMRGIKKEEPMAGTVL